MVTATDYEQTTMITAERLLEPQEIPLPTDDFTCARMPRHLPWADVGSLLRVRLDCRGLNVQQLRRLLGRSFKARRRYLTGEQVPGSYGSGRATNGRAPRRRYRLGSTAFLETRPGDLDPDRALRCRDEMARRAQYVLTGSASDERDLTTAACLRQLLRIMEGTEIR